MIFKQLIFECVRGTAARATMPRAYSDDLRWRIVWQHHFLDIAAERVAEIMQVSERIVYRYTERFQLTGEVRNSLQRSGPLPTLSEHEEFILCIWHYQDQEYISESYNKNYYITLVI